MQIKQDYYQVLGVAPNADMTEIKGAYYKLAFLYHPDMNQNNPETNGKMLEINEAYATLADPVKRREYDLPRGYSTNMPRFPAGSKVRVKTLASPFNDHIGVVDQEPVKGNFRFWYMVKIMSNGLASVGRFAEEQLDEVDQNNPVSNEKMLEMNKTYSVLHDTMQQRTYGIPLGYHTAVPRFKTGSKVRVSSRASPFNDHVGVVDQEPIKGNFRFWYVVKILANDVATVTRFAEEQLHEVD